MTMWYDKHNQGKGAKPMIGALPGTTIETDLSRDDAAQALLSPLFLTGGLVLSQVAQLTGLEPYVIQNWIKRGFVSPPKNKKYSRGQLCRIATINLLKDCLRLDQITRLLSYLNGNLTDESDDLIDDFELYATITRLVFRLERSPQSGREEWQAWCAQVLEDYAEPYPGARDRVRRGLQVIITAYAAARLKGRAEQMLRALDL